MELQNSLTQIGFNDKQAKVYLASLQLGLSNVAAIANETELKRPTVYLILYELEQMGYITRVVHDGKTLIKPENPQKIILEARQKSELAKTILPSLEAIYNVDPNKPNIKIGEGSHGVRLAYNRIFTYLGNNPDEELLIFGSLKDALANFETQVLDYFYESVGRSKNSVREIGNDDHETRKYYRNSVRLNPKHEIRLIRNDGRFFETDNMLFGNTLVIFSVRETNFAVTIESPNIAETYRTLFNMAWRSGKVI